MNKFSLKKLILLVTAGCLALCAALMCACRAGCGMYASTLDWAVDLIKAYYYEDVSEEAIRSAGLENLSGNVLDIYSTYYTAEENAATNSSNAGSRSGVGISYQVVPQSLGASIGSGLYVTDITGGSPAEASGMRPGTFVTGGIAADGTRMDFEDSADFSTFFSAHGDGEQFTLLTDSGEYTMAKSAYKMSYCRMATAESEWNISYDASGREMSVRAFDSDNYFFLPEGCAYISLAQFYGDAAYEMAALLKQFNAMGCTSLILDLRNNGGGYVDVMQSLAHLFTADLASAYPDAMYAVFKDGSTADYAVDAFTSDESCFFPAGTQLYILANNGTASASEALIGVLISNGVADYSDIYVSHLSEEYLSFVGMQDRNERTYGKGIMQSTFTYYLTGEGLKLTVAKIYWPDKTTCIHDTGIGVAQGCNVVGAEWSVTRGDDELRSVCAMLSGDRM